jgi:hypothetical protein
MHKQAQNTTIFSYMSLPSPEHMSVKWVQVQVDLVRLKPKKCHLFYEPDTDAAWLKC